MTWGVLADIHSNQEALDAVLAALRGQGAEGYVCCGDIVGYGPSPNEVVETVGSLPAVIAVTGNHDLAVLGRMSLEWFNEYAQAAAVWTRWKLSPAAARYLESLAEKIETPSFTVAHGSPRNPAEEYLLTAQQFVDNIKHFKSSPCFIGHSHLTVCFSPAALPLHPLGVETRILGDGDAVSLPDATPWIINPGSVGQPRDRDPRASCGLYDDRARRFRILRVPYDIPAVQRKMREVGLPEFLGLRLACGQ